MAMNRSEYRDLVIEEKNRVHTFVAWLLRDLEEARDVTQESLIRLWEHRETVSPSAGRSWLLKTAHRLSLDRLRRVKRRAEVPLEALASVLAGREPGPGQSAGDAEVRAGVGRALAELSPRDRSVIVLREIARMRYAEIADVLGQSVPSIKVSLHRARERMRNLLVEAGVRP